MKELIDRETTVKQICKMGEMLGIGHDRDVTIAVALFVQDDKSAFPTVERPHGEWLWKEYDPDYDCGDIVCSKCSVVIYEGVSQARLKVVKWPFCPNCGADMRKEGEAE